MDQAPRPKDCRFTSSSVSSKIMLVIANFNPVLFPSPQQSACPSADLSWPAEQQRICTLKRGSRCRHLPGQQHAWMACSRLQMRLEELHLASIVSTCLVLSLQRAWFPGYWESRNQSFSCDHCDWCGLPVAWTPQLSTSAALVSSPPYAAELRGCDGAKVNLACGLPNQAQGQHHHTGEPTQLKLQRPWRLPRLRLFFGGSLGGVTSTARERRPPRGGEAVPKKSHSQSFAALETRSASSSVRNSVTNPNAQYQQYK